MKYFRKTSRAGEWRATLWYTAASLFTKAFGFLTIPLYTNLLTTGEYGYLNTYNAWIGILSVVLGLSLNSAVISIQKERKEIKAAYQSSVLGLSLISFLVMGGGILLVCQLIWKRIPGLLSLALIQSYAVSVFGPAVSGCDSAKGSRIGRDHGGGDDLPVWQRKSFLQPGVLEAKPVLLCARHFSYSGVIHHAAGRPDHALLLPGI